MAGQKIDYVSDWAARVRSRIYTQFRNKVTWEKWVTLIARQAQDLEDAFQTLLLVYDIDNSGGVNLDLIGRVVGQPRLGVVDATYRLYLRARILANRSTGNPESLYALFVSLFSRITGSFLKVTTSDIGVKAFVLRVDAVITHVEAKIAAYFLGLAKEAGARAILEFRESESAVTFTYDGTAAQGYDAGLYAGAWQA